MITYLARTLTAQAIADRLSAAFDVHLSGDANAPVVGLSTFWMADAGALCYLSMTSNREWPTTSQEQTVICQADNSDAVRASAKIIVADPRAAIIFLLQRLSADPGLDWSRTLSAQAGDVEPGTYHAHPTAVIEQPVIIGADVVLDANVVVKKGVVIGKRTIIGAGTVIGGEGAAVHKAPDGSLLRQPHVGIVLIGANCQIGVHSFVARAAFGATRIGSETRIGNYVNIGHGTDVGERSWIAVGSVIGGHVEIGRQATLGMCAVVRDGIKIGDGASVGMGSVVTKNLGSNASVFGNPARATKIAIVAGPAR